MCLLIISVVAGPLRAEEEKLLVLEDAFALSLKNNPRLLVERQGLDVAKGGLLRARIYPYNPELRVEPGFGRGKSVETGDGRSTRGFQIGLSQKVEIKGQRGLRVRKAEGNLKQVDWLVRDAEREVRAGVAREFSSVLVAQERLKFAGDIVSLSKELLNISRELFKADAVPQLDVLRAEVELRRAVNEQTAESRRLNTVKKELNLLIGQPPDYAFRATGPLLYNPLPETDTGRLTALAVENRPDLKAAELGVNVADADLALARADSVFPEINVQAGYVQDRDFDSSDRRATMGVSIPLPLINRRQGERLTASAERSRQISQAALVRARVEKEVQQALGRFTASKSIVEGFVKEILPQQEKNFNLVREGYELGQFRLTDVFVILREFIDGRLRYLEAVQEYNNALADLEEATGSKLIATNK